MPSFVCSVCGAEFSLPDEVLAKYPGWTPRYCREHSPKKNKSISTSKNVEKTTNEHPATSITATKDLTPAEVLERFTAGPDTGIFTDGSARPNPGPGGWGAVRVENGEIKFELKGHEAQTTNNRMEYTALINVMRNLPEDEEVTIYTDSNLCVNSITKWASGWEKRGWKRKDGEIENLDLVKEAYSLFMSHPKLKIEWIKAHCGWRWNEYANALATSWAFMK